jgi:hypothetical protein
VVNSQPPTTNNSDGPYQLGKRGLTILCPRFGFCLLNPFVVFRHHLHERLIPQRRLNLLRIRAVREHDVLRDHLPHDLPIVRVERVEIDHAWIEATLEVPRRIKHVRDAAAHACRKVPPGPAEHDHPPAGHVLAPVIADPLDDRVRAAVPHGKSLAGHAAQIRLAARRAI